MYSRVMGVCFPRFRVLIEILKPDKTDATVSLKGVENVVVPALATREYKMSFLAYKEGQYNTKVWGHTHIWDGSWKYLWVLYCISLSLSFRWHFITMRQTSTCSTWLPSWPRLQEPCPPLSWWPLHAGQPWPPYRWRTPWAHLPASPLCANVLTSASHLSTLCQDSLRWVQSNSAPTL